MQKLYQGTGTDHLLNLSPYQSIDDPDLNLEAVKNATALLLGVLGLADDVPHGLVLEEVGGAPRLEDGPLEGEGRAVELWLEGVLPRVP